MLDCPTITTVCNSHNILNNPAVFLIFFFFYVFKLYKTKKCMYEVRIVFVRLGSGMFHSSSNFSQFI